MLRRVGLAHRQYLRCFGAYTGYRDRSLPQVSYQLASVRWLTPAALAYKSTTRHASNEEAKPPEASQTTSSSGILSSISNLLSRSADEKAILKVVQKSPHLSKALTDPTEVRKLAEAFANTQTPLKSYRVLSLAHTLGCNLKQNAYECVSFQLSRAKNWQTILSIVSLGKRQTGRTTSRLLNWRARALVETRHYALLQGVLKEFEEYKLLPTRRTFHLILSGHIRNRDLVQAKECFRIMAEAGFPVDASTHAIVATNYRSFGADVEVQSRSLESLQDVNSSTATAILNSLIQVHLDSHDLQSTLRLLILFDQLAINIIFTEMSSLNQGSIGENALGRPTDTPSLTRQHIYPNASTFSMFINYMATQSNIAGALRIFRSMVTVGIKPNSNVVTSLIHAFYSAGQGNIAVRMVVEMCDAKRAPLSMFKAILSSPPWDDPPWVPSGMMPTVQIFNALLRGALSVHGLESIHVILRVMRASDITPNSRTLEILAAYLSKMDRGNPRVLLRFLRGFPSSTFRSTPRLMHTILSSILRHEKHLIYGSGWDTTAASFSSRHQEPRKHYPNVQQSETSESFDPAGGLKLSKSLSHRPLVRSLFQSLSARHSRSDPAMIALSMQYDALIRSDTETAKETLHTLLVRGMHPNEYHISSLMEGLTRSGNIQGALDLMKSAERMGIKPNVVMFTILIVGHARQGNPELAIRGFQHMILAGINPDVPSIDAVVSAFFAAGAYTMAKRVLISLWPHIQPFPRELRDAPLKDLARHFRQLHAKNRGEQGAMTKKEQLALHLKMRTLWKAWNQQWKRRSGLMKGN